MHRVPKPPFLSGFVTPVMAVLFFQSTEMEIILYSADGSNSSQRVEWALRYKKIPYKVHLNDSNSFGAYGYVPAISIDGAIVSESMAILELLEETYPAIPLLAKQALERAKIREVCEYVNSTIHPA
mgnify:CR=1 FL=1